MARRKPLAPIRDLPTDPVPIDTGTAQLKAVDGGLLLLINGAESSSYDFRDPTYLDFEYMQYMNAITTSFFGIQTPLNALHLGGAGCTLARAWSALRPGSTSKVIEIDRKLADLVRTWFNLPKSPEVSIRVGDAALLTPTYKDNTFDVLVRDVFSGTSTPQTVASTEITQHYSRILKENGLYLANVASQPNSDWAAREYATIASIFPHVIAVCPATVGRGDRRGNIVMAASHTAFKIEEISILLRKLPLPVGIVNDKIKYAWSRQKPL
ncbi:fused MFS/spermidine synthase [Actinomycetaceae bacterium TAE3-ERU4]|nr:fused MFS/spermidine synthase [Actinomycetaceae bacterium TAE3-ERU4]